MKLIRDKFLSVEIYTLSVKEIDKFFEDNYPFKMSNSGTETFLKSLKIPVSYFIKQPVETQMELLLNQKQLFTPQDKELIVLKRNDIIEFVTMLDSEYFNELGDRVPVSKDWIFIEEDLKSGYQRYFMTADKVVNDDYMLGTFIDYPILFSKPMVVNVGFYKISSVDSEKNSEILIPNTKIRLKNETLPETDHNRYFLDLIDNVKKVNIDKTIQHLQNISVDSESCINLLLSFEKDKLINKSQSKKIRKYIEKEELQIANLLELVELANLFIPNLKTYSSKFKFKHDTIYAILLKHNKLPNIDFIQDFQEGY